MKSSVKEGRRSRSSKCLIVDGYNVIARLQSSALKNVQDLDAAREGLLNLLTEHRSFSGDHVILVFDAQRTDAAAVESDRSGVRLIFTYKNETADERIERLVYELRDVYREITVATSDSLEQQVAFGGGALRISADELIRHVQRTKEAIRSQMADQNAMPSRRIGDNIRQDVANILEKWRRQ
ncbi:MAG: hypothetical protein A2201_00305 [Alicyclobacillus sp. RIFOXYA1_FULL_53_8]|nr:MAG: hypothetical protein A2201_00305 [Alicyclobacillus sp. RIFOXYA1_FULL_53_8]